MSSYICGALHFNTIQAKTLEMFKHERFHAYPFKKFELYQEPEKLVRNNLIKLFSGLRELNVVAFYLQYKHHYNGTLDQEIQEALKDVNAITPVRSLTYLGLYNGLRCLNYQIEIEHLKGIREDLYIYHKFLQILIPNTAKFICNTMPEDKTNTWEVD